MVERKSTDEDYGGDFSTFGPPAQSVLLLPFVTPDKRKCPRGTSGNGTKTLI